MEEITYSEPEKGQVLCCECGLTIEPNAANTCVGCIRSRIDITEDIPKQSRLYFCKFCERYLVPPDSWISAQLESKELLSLALKKLKPSMHKVKLVDASFIWTEPHSKRIKVKLTIQKEVLTGAVLQQSFIVEFVVINQMCDECRRMEANDFWRACVQVRQKCDFKKTLFYLEQLLIKHGMHINTTGIKPVSTGIDFYYTRIQDARKLVDFINCLLPCKYQYAQELVTHDTKNCTYDYKHTFCVDVVPICKDSIICLPKKLAQSYGNMNQFVICLHVSSLITLIDPSNLQVMEISAAHYYREPFEMLCQPKNFSEFYVIDVEEVMDLRRAVGHGHVSERHRLVDVWVMRSDQVGVSDAQMFSARSHLGLILKPGDLVSGFDVLNSNVNSKILDNLKPENVPDVILVRKIYDRSLRQKKRKWKLKRLKEAILYDTASVENEFENFMEDVEEDEVLREKVNIYKDKNANWCESSTTGDDLDIPKGPSLIEMLDDLELSEDVEMK